MEGNNIQSTELPKRKLKLREKVLAYVVEHQEHGIVLPAVLAGVLICALVVIGVADKKSTARFEALAHTEAFDDVARVTFVGDIVLGRNVEKRANEVGYENLFSKIQPVWKDSDCIVANLDTCVTDENTDMSKPIIEKDVYFHTDRKNLSALKDAGIDVLSVATDHIADYGRATVKNAVEELDSLGIDHVGAGEDRETAAAYVVRNIETKNGNTIKVAIIGALGHQDSKFGARTKRVREDDTALSDGDVSFSDITLNDDAYESDVTESTETKQHDPWKSTAGTFSGHNQLMGEYIYNARREADVVIIYMHWGDDKMFVESESMRALAHSYIDAGADVVIGTNPRVLLPAERYKSNIKTGYIFYSIGAFVFDDAVSRVCDCISLDVIIDGNMNKTIEITPLRVNACIPSETDNVLYRERIFATLTKNLDKSAYVRRDNILVLNFD